jgi:hypothetical protein
LPRAVFSFTLPYLKSTLPSKLGHETIHPTCWHIDFALFPTFEEKSLVPNGGS